MSQVSPVKPELIFIDAPCSNREELFSFLADKLSEKGYVQNTWHDAIVERERLYPTGLECASLSVAIPHTDPIHLKKPYIAVVKPCIPIEFEFMAQAGGPVQAQMIFNLGVTKSEEQVGLLQDLMAICSDSESSNKLLEAQTPEDLYKVLTELI